MTIQIAYKVEIIDSAYDLLLESKKSDRTKTEKICITQGDEKIEFPDECINDLIEVLTLLQKDKSRKRYKDVSE